MMELQTMNQELQAAFAICCVPVSPMRLEPSHRSEMVSQQLFGERCLLLDIGSDGWVKIQTRFEGYEGWCQQGQVTAIDEVQYLAASNELTAEWTNEVTYNGTKMLVPLGSSLSAIGKETVSWEKNMVQFEGARWNSENKQPDERTIRTVAQKFLNTAYLWGGKSVFGIDCSGFSQTVYKFLNIALPRDAHQQAGLGETIESLKDARCGDLAFFENTEGRITHVGLLLNESEIIHASVKVRIDHIDQQGIINSDTLKRTHHLKIIRRFFEAGRILQ